MLKYLKISKYGLLVLDLIAFLVAYQLGHYVRLDEFHTSLIVPGTVWFLPFVAVVLMIMDSYNPFSHDSRMGFIIRMILAFVILSIVLSLFVFLTFGEELQRYVGRGVLYFSIGFFGLYLFASRFVFASIFDQSKMRNRWLILTEEKFVPFIDREIRRRFSEWQVGYLLQDAKAVKKKPKLTTKKDQNSNNTVSIEQNLNLALEKHKWDGVVIATDAIDTDEMELLLERRLHGLTVTDLISFYERYFLKIPLYYIEHSHFMIGRGFFVLSNPIGLRLKVIMDYCITTILLLLALPLMLILIILVGLDSGRPIFFRQERTGRNGERFQVFKFRTMIVGADKLNPYTQKGDNRITRIGKFLRLTRLDELPQLFNILMGQMSLIGPRAEWTKLTDQYEQEIPFYNLRHLVHPGLTGWAQVMYPYGANIDDTIHKLEYDLYYIKNYTAFLDISILLKTVRIVLFGGGR